MTSSLFVCYNRIAAAENLVNLCAFCWGRPFECLTDIVFSRRHIDVPIKPPEYVANGRQLSSCMTPLSDVSRRCYGHRSSKQWRQYDLITSLMMTTTWSKFRRQVLDVGGHFVTFITKQTHQLLFLFSNWLMECWR